MWHVSSRSGVATLRTAIHLLLTYLLTYLTPPPRYKILAAPLLVVVLLLRLSPLPNLDRRTAHHQRPRSMPRKSRTQMILLSAGRPARLLQDRAGSGRAGRMGCITSQRRRKRARHRRTRLNPPLRRSPPARTMPRAPCSLPWLYA